MGGLTEIASEVGVGDGDELLGPFSLRDLPRSRATPYSVTIVSAKVRGMVTTPPSGS